MAIYTPSIIGSISGDLAGASFVNARGSKVVRQKRRPSPNNTQDERENQNLLARAVITWNESTELRKQAWRNYAALNPLPNRLGIKRPISGYNMFLKLHIPFSLLLPPATDEETPNVTIIFESSVATGLEAAPTGAPIPGPWAADLFGRPLYRTTQINHHGTLRKLGVVFSSFSLPISLDVAWQTQFELPVLGQAVVLALRPRNSFLASGPLFQETVITIA